jgi:hypothetical protein
MTRDRIDEFVAQYELDVESHIALVNKCLGSDMKYDKRITLAIMALAGPPESDVRRSFDHLLSMVDTRFKEIRPG